VVFNVRIAANNTSRIHALVCHALQFRQQSAREGKDRRIWDHDLFTWQHAHSRWAACFQRQFEHKEMGVIQAPGHTIRAFSRKGDQHVTFVRLAWCLRLRPCASVPLALFALWPRSWCSQSVASSPVTTAGESNPTRLYHDAQRGPPRTTPPPAPACIS